MESKKVPYEQQIFVCTNNCQGEKASCGDHQGEAVFKELRRIAKERKLHPRIRVAQAKCLGQCSQGVNIMVTPGDIWHSGVRLEDVRRWRTSICRLRKINRLLISISRTRILKRRSTL